MLKHEDFIFFHMAKCAGTTIEKNFKAINSITGAKIYGHHRPEHLNQNEINNKKIIGSLRNPFAWYPSLYFHFMRNIHQIKNTNINVNKGTSFQKFIKKIFLN